MSKAVRTHPGATPAVDLPGSLDSFVGRESELGESRQLLRRARLLTLLGPVGSGKTRLAIELARWHASVRDQVGFAELSSLTSAEELEKAVATALRVRERPGETLMDSLVAALGSRQVLLLLDGCEYVVEACAELVEVLLRRCPNVQVLATSQELLRVSGEVTFAIPPMSLPDPARPSTPAELSRSDAVELFVSRARQHMPDFRLTPANSAAVAAICTRLDGMPLAVEMAAQWVRMLPVEELLTHLDDRFELLTAAPRTASGRHRDLRAAIGASVELLEPREQVLFRRLSVFPGGFDLAAASTVCADDEVPHGALLKAMSGLETKSLVTLADSRGQAARFGQLESIRLYGLEQLKEAGETETVHDRLVRWLTKLVESLPEQVCAYADTLRKLAEESTNLLRAVEWTARRGDERHALLAVAAARCSWERGDAVAARALLKSALGQTYTDPRYRSVALQQAAWLNCWQGRDGTALALAQEAIGVERPLDRPFALGEALGVLGLVQLARSEFTAARSCLEESLNVVRPLGRQRHTARSMHHFAWATLRAGEVGRASDLLDEVLEVVRTEAAPALLAAVQHTSGALALVRGDMASAETRFKESLQADRPNGYDTPRALEGLAITAVRERCGTRALHLLGAATTLRNVRTEPDPAWQRSVGMAATEARRMLHRSEAESALAAGGRLLPVQAVGYALGDMPNLPGSGKEPEHGLTERECEVARLVAGGMTNRQIASRLRVSPRTVDAHLMHIRNKLGLQARAQVAVWAARQVSLSSSSSARNRPERGLPGPPV